MILLDIAFFYTILAFGIAELILIVITIYHGIRPTLSQFSRVSSLNWIVELSEVILCILGMEMIVCLIKLIFAIVMMTCDGGKECGWE